MSHREESGDKENHERWMISYADFITLLMIFFVVLYSMSKIDEQKYEAMARSLGITMGGGAILPGMGGEGVLEGTAEPIDLSGPTQIPEEARGEEAGALASVDPLSRDDPEPEAETPEEIEARQLAGVKEQLDNYFKQQGMDYAVQTAIDERGLVVSLKDAILFDTGETDIKSDMIDRLIQVGNTINAIPNYVRVEGHTDNVPISAGIIKSNWELSVLRATTVLHLFADQSDIPPQKLSAVGYGEYRPLNDNSTPELRAHNRRVDVIILNSKFNELERSQSEI